MQITIEVPDNISKETVLQQIAGLEKKLRILKVRQEKKATGGNMVKNTQWLQRNAADYRGKWVALKNGKLLGSHEKQVELYWNLKQSGRIAGSMFFRVEN